MSNKLVTLVHYRLGYRAHILKARLEEEGIEASVTGKTVLDAGDGVRILVLDDNLEKAIEVMNQLHTDFEEDHIIDQAE